MAERVKLRTVNERALHPLPYETVSDSDQAKSGHSSRPSRLNTIRSFHHVSLSTLCPVFRICRSCFLSEHSSDICRFLPVVHLYRFLDDI